MKHATLLSDDQIEEILDECDRYVGTEDYPFVFARKIESKMLSIENDNFWRKRAQQIQEQYVSLKKEIATNQSGMVRPTEPIGYFHTGNGKISCTQLTSELMECMTGETGQIPLYAIPPKLFVLMTAEIEHLKSKLAETPSNYQRFQCWSNNEGDTWYECPEDAQIIYDIFGDEPAVGAEYELTAGWNSVTARYRIISVDGNGDCEVECISHPEEND